MTTRYPIKSDAEYLAEAYAAQWAESDRIHIIETCGDWLRFECPNGKVMDGDLDEFRSAVWFSRLEAALKKYLDAA